MKLKTKILSLLIGINTIVVLQYNTHASERFIPLCEYWTNIIQATDNKEYKMNESDFKKWDIEMFLKK